MAKKSKVVSVRVNSEKLKILKETGVKFADFVRRSLDVYEEQWRLKKYKNSEQLGKALVTILRIETLEAERLIIERKLKEIDDRWPRTLRSYQDAKKAAGFEEGQKINAKIAEALTTYRGMETQFKGFLKKNEVEMEACRKEYLEAFSLEQIKKRCCVIHI